MDERLEALWSEYRQTGSSEAEARLTLHYAPLVKFVGGRVANGSESVMRAGLESLRGAIETFDGSDHFESYAISQVTQNLDVDVPVW